MKLSGLSFSREPALYAAIADALLVLAVTFGLPITAEQKGIIDTLLSLVAGVFIRSQVTPVASLPAAAAPTVLVPPTLPATPA